jgi:hypothetical protein
MVIASRILNVEKGFVMEILGAGKIKITYVTFDPQLLYS